MAMAFSPNYTVRNYTWTVWKTIWSSKSLIHQYDDDGLTYTIYGYDGPEVIVCTIWKGEVPYTVIANGYTQVQNDLDKADFVTNYLSTANTIIGTTSTTVSTKHAMDVNVTSSAAANDTTGSGTITALSGAVTASTTGCSTASFYVTGTWVGTISAEVSVNGVNFSPINGIQTDKPNPVLVGSFSSNLTLLVPCGGYRAVRLRSSAFTSGTVNVTWVASVGVNTQNVLATPTDGSKATFSAGVNSLNLALLATDVFSITGSATKTIRITNMFAVFSGAGALVTATIVKRSTANSGGTFTTATAVPHDNSNPAATATVRAYTLNPTLGTLVGNVRSTSTNSPLVSGTTNPAAINFTFGDRPGQAIILRGTGDVLAFNLAGVTLAGTVTAYVEWTEEG